MKLSNKKLLCLLIAALLLASGCSAQPDGIRTDDFWLPAEAGIACEQTGEDCWSISQDGWVIGGVIRGGGLSERSMPADAPFGTGAIMVLQEMGVLEESTEYMASSAAYGDVQVWIGTAEGGQTHYLFFAESAAYDVWFAENAVDGDNQAAILEGISYSAMEP